MCFALFVRSDVQCVFLTKRLQLFAVHCKFEAGCVCVYVYVSVCVHVLMFMLETMRKTLKEAV